MADIMIAVGVLVVVSRFNLYHVALNQGFPVTHCSSREHLAIDREDVLSKLIFLSTETGLFLAIKGLVLIVIYLEIDGLVFPPSYVTHQPS